MLYVLLGLAIVSPTCLDVERHKVGRTARSQDPVEVEPSEVTQERHAPEGPAVSGRRFQPAENGATRIGPTPTGLTGGPAPPGPMRFFASFPWVAPTATRGLPLRGVPPSIPC